MKKLLFISHDAFRTGAPILLLNLVKWINEQKQNDYLVSVLFVAGGPLISEFDKYADTYLLGQKNNSKNIFTRIKNRIGKNKKEAFYNKNWDLIFSNTIVNGKTLKDIRKHAPTTPIVSYVHELDFLIDQYFKKGKVQGSLQYSDYFLCGSKLVQKTLIEKYNVKEPITKVVYSFIDFKTNNKNKLVSDNLRAELQIPKEALIVAMAGTFDWRKGVSFFIKTAEALQKEDVYFLWIGADNQEEINRIQYDLEKSNSRPKVLYIPSSPDYKKYFNLFDVFYLSSREDPYPLVMVDASSFGIPIICFKDVGGTQEFIDNKTGFVVPYADINSVADKIKYYNCNRNVLIENKEYIKEKSSKFHDVNNNAKIIIEFIEKIVD